MNSVPQTIIRQPKPEDYPAWLALWHGYNKFYRARVPPEATAATWARITTANPDIVGLVAETEAALTGFAHLVFHPSSWSTTPSCYLEDLFVTPAARGTGTAEALIQATATAARARDANRLYWHTQEFNAPARSLYDTLANRTSFIVYNMELGTTGP